MIANLHIQAACRHGKTYLKKAYYTQPFKVADITEDRREPHLRLMLMSASPGVLDGDTYQMKIEVEENGSLQLETQSYQRLFHMQQGAMQQMEVHLATNSSFEFVPFPVVPHEGANFKARNRIFLSNGCRLLWGEVLTSGRKLSGENFLFNRYHNVTEIFFEGRLVIKENLLLEPAKKPVYVIGQLEGYSHQATLIFLDEQADITYLTSIIAATLSWEKTIEFGISALPANGLLVRILGHKGEQLFKCLKTMARILNQVKKPDAQPEPEPEKPIAYAT